MQLAEDTRTGDVIRFHDVEHVVIGIVTDMKSSVMTMLCFKLTDYDGGHPRHTVALLLPRASLVTKTGIRDHSIVGVNVDGEEVGKCVPS